MNKVIRYYLYLLPLLALVGIILSVLRTAYQDSYTEVFLLFTAFLDLIIILFSRKYMNSTVVFVIILLIISFLTGLLNNELSRRFVTDFTNPLFFFIKIYIFKNYWKTASFSKYVKYYSRISFIGSLALLPVTYYLFNKAGSTRLAIFPPMEIPFSNYMLTNLTLTFAAFLIILLYGKRAQLVSALVTFFLYIFIFRRKSFVKYLFLLIVGGVLMVQIFTIFSDNLAIRRISASVELYSDNSNENKISSISAGRDKELEALTENLEFMDYITGKGMGFTYLVSTRDDVKEVSNTHFSPISLLSKYGVVFTVFLYVFLLRFFIMRNKNFMNEHAYLVALSVSLIVFFESFFAYALFVTPIFPMVLGVLMMYRDKKKAIETAVPQTNPLT